MQRAILLQTDATKSKHESLNAFSVKALETANFLLSNRKSRKLMDLHKVWYSVVKKSTSFNSQVVCDIERCVCKSKGGKLNAITIKFNTPRNCKTFNTKSRFFVKLGLYPRKTIPVPIRKNGNYQRYTDLLAAGWACKTYGLTSDGQVVAYLFKKDAELSVRKNVVGVDVNSKFFAVSVLSPNGQVLKQLYYGKDIWIKRKRIFRRREMLQSYADRGSRKAVKKLRLLGIREHNFVKNRIGEVVRDITDLALKYDADIGIEDLKRFKPKGRRFNKEVLRIPTLLFKTNMEARCFDKELTLDIRDAYHTSKWCTHCGAVVNGHSASNYALFVCDSCKQVVNSDRKASLAISVKSLLVRNKEHILNKSASFQFTSRQVPVNGLFRPSDDVVFCAVHINQPLMESQRL